MVIGIAKNAIALLNIFYLKAFCCFQVFFGCLVKIK